MVTRSKQALIMAVALLLLPLLYTAQNTIYKEVYNHNTSMAPAKILMDKTIIFYSNGFVYTTGQRSALDNDLLIIKKYNTQTEKTSLIQIKREKDYKTLFSESIDAMAIQNNKLVIVMNTNIFIFKDENGTYKLEKAIKNEWSFNKIYLLTNKDLLLYVNYNFHPNDAPDKHLWAKLDIETDQVFDVKKMEDNNVVFSYFVNDWISTYKGLIAYSQTTDYSIGIYDQDYHKIDSVKSSQFEGNKKVMGIIPKGEEYSADEMGAIGRADDTLLKRIQKIFLLDSTHLLVTVKLPKTRNYQFDLWTKKNNSWSVEKTNTLPGFYVAGKEYNKSNNYITGFFGNMDGLTYSKNGEFYFFYFPYIENIVTKSFDRKKDYEEKVNGMMRKKEMYYGIKKIKILEN